MSRGSDESELEVIAPPFRRSTMLLIGAVCGLALSWTPPATAARRFLLNEPAPRAAAPPAPAKTPAKAAAQPVAAQSTTHDALVAAAAAKEGKLVVGVFGDSLGDGLWAGLYRTLRADDRFEIRQFSRISTGLLHAADANVGARVEAQLAAEAADVDVAVVLLGANDRDGMRTQNGYVQKNTPAWRQAYGDRVEALARKLQAHGVPVYWVGMPKLRNATADADATVLNEVFAERVARVGAPFIPLVPATVDETGAYSAHLPRAGVAAGAGPKVLIRAADGLHMTPNGYERIARPVADRLRADLARAAEPTCPPTAVTVASARAAS